jgi:hypothetical protein
MCLLLVVVVALKVTVVLLVDRVIQSVQHCAGYVLLAYFLAVHACLRPVATPAVCIAVLILQLLLAQHWQLRSLHATLNSALLLACRCSLFE